MSQIVRDGDAMPGTPEYAYICNDTSNIPTVNISVSINGVQYPVNSHDLLKPQSPLFGTCIVGIGNHTNITGDGAGATLGLPFLRSVYLYANAVSACSLPPSLLFCQSVSIPNRRLSGLLWICLPVGGEHHCKRHFAEADHYAIRIRCTVPELHAAQFEATAPAGARSDEQFWWLCRVRKARRRSSAVDRIRCSGFTEGLGRRQTVIAVRPLQIHRRVVMLDSEHVDGTSEPLDLRGKMDIIDKLTDLVRATIVPLRKARRK